IPLFVVPTPPEIAKTYGLSADACRVPAGQKSWDQWLDTLEPLPGAPSGAISSMIYTSGTTGNPKGVRRVLDAQSAAAMSRLAREVFDIAPGQIMRTVVTGPVYHSAPNFFALTAVRDGGLAILQPRFVGEGLLQLIRQHKLPPIHRVPTMFCRVG